MAIRTQIINENHDLNQFNHDVYAWLQTHQDDQNIDIYKIQELISIEALDEFEQRVGGLIAKRTDDSIHLTILAVKPNIQGKGIGKQLYEALETYAKENQILSITVTTLSFQAKPFYEKMGFKQVGVYTDVPKQGVDKYLLQKKLTD